MAETDSLAVMRAEVEKIRDEAAAISKAASWRATAWTRLNLLLGFPSAVLAAGAGATGLASSSARVIAAGLALGASGFAAGREFLRSDVRNQANRRSRRAWAALEGEARLLLARDDLTREEMLICLRALFEQRIAAMSAYEGQ